MVVGYTRRMSMDPEKWERIRLMIASGVESGINEGLEIARHPCPVLLFTESELRDMITQLAPRHAVSAGQQFLLKLLDCEGPAGLDRFMRKANESLLEDSRLDWEDFNERQKLWLRESSPDLSRRKFLTYAAGAFGAGAIGKNIIMGLDHQYNGEESKGHVTQPELHATASRIEGIAPVIETGLGATALAYALKERTGERLDQVTQAITKLSRQVRANAPGAWSNFR